MPMSMMIASVYAVFVCGSIQERDDAKELLADAVAVWHMADASDGPARDGHASNLEAIGEGVQFGVELDGKERALSIAYGGDGRVVRLDGGALAAGQGAGGELNIAGDAVTVLIRFQRLAGGDGWNITPITKNGGHAALQYNLYCVERTPDMFELGAEIGTERGLGRATTTVRTGSHAMWHNLVLRYDGKALDLFWNGTRCASAPHTGRLRPSNDSPLIISGEPQGGAIKRRMTALVDHAAIWARGLSDTEIRTLNGGVSATREQSPRPVLHFTPMKNWMNDPNGLIWVNGEYHLFYQHNPFGDQWGHMSWGHAVSPDLFSWEHRPVAIPEADGVMAFSGTAALDRNNTTGLGTVDQPPLIAMYTGHADGGRLQHQNFAWSVDAGRTWTKYEKNPVLDLGLAEFRDPKIFWHEPTARWIMVVALPLERSAAFFVSPDLKQWRKVSQFGNAGRTNIPNWECPDLFEMKIEGEAETRWVLVASVGGNGPVGGSGCQYFVGTFDGEKFVNENSAETVLWLNEGSDFYAFQSFADAPAGKRIGIAWMTNLRYAGAVPTTPWRGAMTAPVEYTLVRTSVGLRLRQRPLEGTATFLKSRGAVAVDVRDRDVSAGIAAVDVQGSVMMLEATFAPKGATCFGLRVREGRGEHVVVGYDVAAKQLFVDRGRSGATVFYGDVGPRFVASAAPAADGTITFTIVVDHGSVEVFSGDGLAAMSVIAFSGDDSEGVSLFAEGGDATLVRLSGVAMPTERRRER